MKGISEEPPTTNPEQESQSDEQDVADLSTSQLWDEIGFHKPIAGFWYNISFTLIAIVLSAFLVGQLMNFFYPFPESFGYKDLVFGYFALMFTLFDMGTGAVMGRFIPEVNINNPEKMLHYIQYFIWYQMLTGLVQTTAVSIYALYYAPQTSISYTVWIMLVVSTTQYPGFLGVFRNTLDSLQHYDKTKLLSFLTGTVIQRVTELLFVYFGRLWGEANPQVGPIMGIAIGGAIGLYVDDFMAMAISAVFFSRVMRQYGITPKMCFRTDFTWAEIKPVVVFSLKTGLPVLVTGPIGFANLLLAVEYIPQYTTLTVLATIGGSIPDVMNWFGTTNITPLVAESYMNDKRTLARYYVGQDIRFQSLLIGFFAPLMIGLYFVMPIAWVELGMVNYLLASIFIIPRLVRISVEKFLGQPGAVLYGANRPNYRMIMDLVQSVVAFGMQVLYLAVWHIPTRFGLGATAWIIQCGHLPVAVLFAAFAYVYVQKRLLKIKIPGKQIVVGISAAAVVCTILDLMVVFFVFIPIYHAVGFYVALVVGIIPLALILCFVFFPLTGFFGAWDDTNLEEFKKAVEMSGPSKWLVKPLHRILAWACRRSPLHDRFGMATDEVEREARELLVIKANNRAQLRRKLEQTGSNAGGE